MHSISLNSETDFDGWRKTARALVLNEVQPSDVTWSVRSDRPTTDPSLETANGTFSVPAKFIELSRVAILHRDGERFATCIACCGGCAAITSCSTSLMIPTSR